MGGIGGVGVRLVVLISGVGVSLVVVLGCILTYHVQ
jgi:hypothetical protein